MMCEQCEELREEVRQLQDQLGVTMKPERRDRIARALHLSAQPAKIINRLYAAKGSPVSAGQILDATATNIRDDLRDINTVRVWMVQLRKALGESTIETVWGRGYRLSTEGMARVAAILGEPL